MNVHIVVKGDTLWKIARQYGISFDELKKVNAHLANPDYIVPGMKIFLPEGGKAGKSTEKHKELPKEKLPEKPSMPKPVAPPIPKAKVPMPPKPKPLPPEKEKIVPQKKPELKPKPEPIPVAPKPTPQPVAPSQPAPTQPECTTPPAVPQPIVQPVYIGIPCGWMPIYDADCHPHTHQYLPQTQFPTPYTAPQQPTSLPPMMPPPQWNWKEESSSKEMDCPDESPVKPGQRPGMAPSDCDDQKSDSLEFGQQVGESPEFDLTPPAFCPPESGYVPQQLPQQNMAPYPMTGMPAMQHPNWMHLCTSCGSQMPPAPYPGIPYMGPMPNVPPVGWYGNSPQNGINYSNQLDTY